MGWVQQSNGSYQLFQFDDDDGNNEVIWFFLFFFFIQIFLPQKVNFELCLSHDLAWSVLVKAYS